MIRAATFDCWDTLIIDDEGRDAKMRAHLKRVCRANDISLADKDVASAFACEDMLREEYVVAHHKTKNAMGRTGTLLELLNVRLPHSEVRRIAHYFDKVALKVRPPLVPQVEEVLGALVQEYRLGVICNGGYHSADTVREILAGYKLEKFFSWLSFSDELDVAKPHPRIFEFTVGKLGCVPEEAVHIGDSEYSDIVGAKNAGMKAILFAGINSKYRDNTKADFVIHNYAELLDTLEKLKGWKRG